MSTATEQLRERWGRNRLHRAMRRVQPLLESHADMMETERGLWAMFMLAYGAMSVAHGQGSQAALDETIRLSAQLTGIPEEALEALTRVYHDMVKCCEYDPQKNEIKC